MKKTIVKKSPLTWIQGYKRYLSATQTKVFNEKGRKIMEQDTSSKEAAVAALKRFGYLDKKGKVAREYTAR